MVAGMSRRTLIAACGALMLAAPSAASAQSLTDPVDQWLPSPENASWTYEWFDSGYAPRRTKEVYTVKQREATSFRLAWTTEGLGNPDDAVQSAGEVDYRRSDTGLINLNWASTPPPPEFPVLCATVANCSNSVAGTHYLLIWGNRSPVLLEPLVRNSRWSSAGGANSDVSSASRYVGRRKVTVPAFPNGVNASVVETDITQAGALGDPYGSGIRTVWWVRGVGPVKIAFRHVGGELTQAELTQTNLAPRPAPSDVDWLPLNRGDKMRFRWRNDKHLRRWSTQSAEVTDVVNQTSRVDVKDVSGPIKVNGSYLFSSRLSGVSNTTGVTRSASRSKLPPLGPLSAPADRRRRFTTPFDFMAFGFNPVLPSYPKQGQTWTARRGSRDHKIYGVVGTSRVLGLRRVRTPLGRLRALAVESTMTQNGFRFGSGTRTMYFAPNRGLVKLVFRHRDGSVSTVERLR